MVLGWAGHQPQGAGEGRGDAVRADEYEICHGGQKGSTLCPTKGVGLAINSVSHHWWSGGKG